MAYWRSYRRLSLKVNTLAAAESSDDESIVENDTLLELHNKQPQDIQGKTVRWPNSLNVLKPLAEKREPSLNWHHFPLVKIKMKSGKL